MANFAEIDENNIVLRVVVVADEKILEDGKEKEQLGVDFLKNLLGANTSWVQTSYTGKIRKNGAGIGFYYDKERDAFIPPKPYNSWILDEDICQWKAPKQLPDESLPYEWNENTLEWILHEQSNNMDN